MFFTKQLGILLRYCKNMNRTNELRKSTISVRKLHLSLIRACENKSESDTKRDALVRLNFKEMENKTKDTYLDMIKIFINRDIHRRGHVEFINSALKYMELYGVHKDLAVYKALVDVLPKGKFIPQNIIQSEFMHYPKQQQCAIELLEQMEDNGNY